MTLRVNDIFTSIQGEGFWAGVPATFIRLQGCNVGCKWCDTKYTWNPKSGTEMTVEQILGQMEILDAPHHVVITGGEPLLQNLDELLETFSQRWYYTQIETSGKSPILGALRPDFITWSPKPNLLYKADKMIYDNCDEVKFVVDNQIGFDVVYDLIKDISSLRPTVYFTLMPEGYPPKEANKQQAYEWVMKIRRTLGAAIRYGGRLQCELKIK